MAIPSPIPWPTRQTDTFRLSRFPQLYWYGSGGEILAETDASGNTLNEYVFFGGQRVAMLPAGSTTQFYVEDFLGTSRVVTTNTGVVCYDADFYPYGGERTVTNSCTQNNYKFEGKERDTETLNDEFGARYYSWRFGRWLSADWSTVPVAVPYANLANPQTLNLYAMVADDPESFADLDGHNPQNPGGGCADYETCTSGGSNVTQGPKPAGRCRLCFLFDWLKPSGPPPPEPDVPLWFQNKQPSSRDEANSAPSSMRKPAAGAAVALPVVVCEIAEPCGIGLDTIVIGAALTLAAGMVVKDIYVHHKEQSQIKAAIKAAKVNLTYEKFSEYLHQYKGSGGRGPGDNYTFAQLVVLAKEAAEYYASHR